MKKSKPTIKKSISPNPFSTSSEKLDLIRTGGKVEHQVTSKESKNFIYKIKGGTKISAKVIKQKFEDAAVLRKKRNYVMYESKLGTEKNTQITAIEEPNSKPIIFREPSPRIEEKIIITKKRKDYLDNYQYKESRVYRNPKKKRRVLVEHIRLGEIIEGFYETSTYQSKIIYKGDNLSRSINDKSKDTMSKTFHGGFKDDKPERINSRRSASSRSLNNPNQEQRYTTSTVTVNRRTTSNILSNQNRNYKKITNAPQRSREGIKSDIVTKQIMHSRDTPKHQPVYQINTYNPRTRQPKEQPKKIEKISTQTLTRNVVKKEDNNLRNSNSRRRIEQPTNKTTSITINKNNPREEINNNLRAKTPRKKEENKNNLRAKTPKNKEDNNDSLRPKTPKKKDENIIDSKQGKKTRKIIEVVKLDDKKKPKAIIEIVKYEKKEEKRPKKKIEVKKIEREEKIPKKIDAEEKIEKDGKKLIKRTEIIIKNKEEKTEEIIFEKKEERPKKSAETSFEVKDTIVQLGKKKSIRNKYKALH